MTQTPRRSAATQYGHDVPDPQFGEPNPTAPELAQPVPAVPAHRQYPTTEPARAQVVDRTDEGVL